MNCKICNKFEPLLLTAKWLICFDCWKMLGEPRSTEIISDHPLIIELRRREYLV